MTNTGYFNTTRIRIIQRETWSGTMEDDAEVVLVEWPNGDRGWLDAAEVRDTPKGD